MNRVLGSALLIAALTIPAFAQEAPQPEECLAKAGDASAVTVSHGGKTYSLASEACRAQFASDAERYSQLYDALLELEAEGTPVRAKATPSLVPS